MKETMETNDGEHYGDQSYGTFSRHQEDYNTKYPVRYTDRGRIQDLKVPFLWKDK